MNRFHIGAFILAALILAAQPVQAGGDGGGRGGETTTPPEIPKSQLRKILPRATREQMEEYRKQETLERTKPYRDAFKAVQQVVNALSGH